MKERGDSDGMSRRLIFYRYIKTENCGELWRTGGLNKEDHGKEAKGKGIAPTIASIVYNS
jgi:hypothetical protein